MGFLKNLFGSKETAEQTAVSLLNPVHVEIHSHLIHDVDDGVQTLEQAADVLKIFVAMGYRKIITTPHVMSDFYKNGAHNLIPKLAELKAYAKEQNIPIELEVAAEYMIDDGFETKIANDDILSFGGAKKYVLVEMPFMAESINLKSVLFELKIRGYQPVLAHPERYTYYHNKKEKYEEFFDQGILLQLNNLSLIGYYSPAVQKAAEYIIEKKFHSFLGSDAHNAKHASIIQGSVVNSRLYKKACIPELLNNTL